MKDPEKLFVQAESEEGQGRYDVAFQLLLTAALMGHPGSQINLGNFYTEGKGTPKDIPAGRGWYERAYLNGERTGAHNLGIDFRNAGDSTNAILWLKKAVDMNDGDACVDLAELLLDKSEKIALLKRAAASSPSDISEDGREQAQALLDELG